MAADAIREYYDECHTDYQLVWGVHRTHAIHAGYYDAEHTSHDAAVENMNRVVADAADVGGGDHVLDAGCGVGGSAAWLAADRSATVTGLNLVPMHVRKARELAAERGVDDATAFLLGDFTEMPIQEGGVDVVWGLESVCYAADKREFLAEAARVLPDGGRLVVADGFRVPESYTPKERAEMDAWLDGWAVPNLASVEGFRADLADVGFSDVEFRDVRENVLPSSRRLYRASRLVDPLQRALERFGLRSATEGENVRAARYQHRTLKEGLWTYGIFTARI